MRTLGMTVSELTELIDLMRSKGVTELRTVGVGIRLGAPVASAHRPLAPVPEEPEPDLTLWSSPFDPTLKGA